MLRLLGDRKPTGPLTQSGEKPLANGLNRVMLLGNLGADPELRMTNSGSAVLKMRIATTESYLDRNRQRMERTEWHNVVVWGRRAEGLAKFLTKGMNVFVEGGLRTSSYDDRDGNRRYKTEIVAKNVVVNSSRRSGGSSSSDSEYGGANYDDDIPF